MSGINSAGSNAAYQLMQASKQVASLSTQQMQAVNNDVAQAKASALQNTADQVASSVERKSNAIDTYA